jgi:hypothetical protein
MGAVVDLVGRLGQILIWGVRGEQGIAIGDAALEQERAHSTGGAGDANDAPFIHWMSPMWAPSSIRGRW